jgi:eukaryotic-like serine/threonine-protein kinase
MTERELFEAALEVPPEDRAAHLDRVCGTDAGVRQRLENLLRKHDRAKSFLETRPPEFARTANGPAIEGVGTQIGPYKLLEQIGEGGFGIVFMAEQHAPVRRRVALKIIKPGMDSRTVLARFDAERQALALMDHPNIARAIDAGVTDSGRPFFVMELVRGVPITDYCDQKNLAVHERLDLFVQVCHAVQHAHQKGIIHRDIKPSNILVTQFDGRPVPKIIDFGIAKAIHQPLTQQTLFTRFAEMIGTPLYMSPEQAEMTALDIDTRSDIYSLGVLLYELLTGTTPFDKNRLKKAAYDEIRRIIREEEPAKPSTRISSLGEKSGVVAAHRHADPRGLSQLVRGDLDWIVMKALEKERSRRYETASGLAMDVERHLADEPVLAWPPSVTYRFAKFARRNRVAFTTAIVVLAAVLAGTVVSVTQAFRATRAERLAESRLQAETAARAEAERAGRAETAQRQVADSRRSEAEAMRKQSDASARQARQTVDDYFTLVSESKLLDVPGLQPLRKKLLESALRYYESFRNQRSGDSSIRSEIAATHLRLAQVYEQNNRIDDSIHEFSRSLDLIEELLREKPLPAGFPRCLAGIRKRGRVLTYLTLWPTDGPEAVRVNARAVAIWERLAREYPNVIGFQSDLASLYGVLSDMMDNVHDRPGAWHAAESSIRLFEKLSEQHPGEPEYRTGLADALEYAARTLRQLGRAPEAWKPAQRALAIREKLVRDFPSTPEYRAACAYSYIRVAGHLKYHTERGEEAAEAYQKGIERWKKLVEEFPSDPGFRKRLAYALFVRAICQMDRGILVDADRNARESREIRFRLTAEDAGEQGDNLVELCQSQLLLAQLLVLANQQKQAQAQLLAAVDSDRKLANRFPQTVDVDTGRRYRDFGFTAAGHGDVEDAEQAFHAAIDLFQRLTVGEPKKLEGWHFLADTHRGLAQVLVAAQHPEEAEQEFRRAIDVHQRTLEKLHVEPLNEEEWAASYLDLVRFLESKGRSQDAEEIIRRFNAQVEALISASPGKAVRREWLARAHYELANSLRDGKRMANAESHYRQALVAYDALVGAPGTNPEYQLKRAQCQRDFALMLTWAGRPADAEREYREAIALIKKLVADAPANGEYRFYLAHSCCGLADLLSNNKRTQEAEDLCRQALALFEKLAADFPSRDNFRVDAGHVLWQLANLAAAAGRPKEAEQHHRRALAIFEKLAADFPQNRYYQWEQGWSDWNIAGLMRQLNRLPDAEKSCRDAADVYAKMVADVPGDGGPRERLAQIEFSLAEVLRSESRLDDAEKHYRLADAAWRKLGADNPTEPSYRIHAISTCTYQLSPLLTAKGRAREAEENYREAVGLLASLPAGELVADDRRDLTDLCYGNLIRLLKISKRPQEATAVFGAWVDLRRKSFTKMLEQNPKSADAQNSFGEALARVGCWDEALAALDKAAELDPANHWYPFRAAPLHLWAGDVVGYSRVCRAMLQRFQRTQSLEVADRTAKTCLLAPDAVPDLDRVQKLADWVVTGTEKHGAYHWFLFVKGLAEYRAGRHAEAVKWLERFAPGADGAHIDASAFAVLAMAQHRLGQEEKARTALHSGQAIVAEKMPDPAAGRPFEGMWEDWLHCQILLREAEALLKPQRQKEDKPAK